jgi:DNA-binding response OmpR family regulator
MGSLTYLQGMIASIPKPKRVFVVDDEADIGLALKLVLEAHGFSVDAFTDPTIALNSFDPQLYDILILDIKMPTMNGFELYSKIKSKCSSFNLKTLFLTALKDLENYGNYKDNVSPKIKERHFIQKPVSNSDLLKQVYSMVN